MFFPLCFAWYSALSAACTSGRPSAPSACTAATPQLVVMLTVPAPSRRGISQPPDLGADALGAVEGAFEIGSGKHHGQLLAAVARGMVDLARALAQDARDLAQDDVALRMTVCVVDDLEVVEIDEDEAEIAPEAPGALDLTGQGRRRTRGGCSGR